MRKAILLDRDGTINVDYGYLSDPSQLEFIKGAVEALTLLGDAGFELIIITNQSGIARGYFTQEQYEIFHAAMLSELSKRGVEIAATYMCPHAPGDGCSCRKPNPTMVLQAIEELGLDPQRSYMFGDKPSDVECGARAGVTARLISGDEDLLYWATAIIENRL